jgi:hypothetical protein
LVGIHLSISRNKNPKVPFYAPFPPPPPPDIYLQLYADNVNFYSRVKKPIDAETVLQPYIGKVARWGREWKFKFSAPKLTSVIHAFI